MPRYEDDEEEEQLEAQSDIDYQSVKELEPEVLEIQLYCRRRSFRKYAHPGTGKIRSLQPYPEEEPAEKDDVLRQLLEETASQMAQQITTGEFQKEEETPAEEETAAPEVEIQDESVPEKEEVSDIEPQNPEGRDMIHDLMAEGLRRKTRKKLLRKTAETEDIRLEESIIAQVFCRR